MSDEYTKAVEDAAEANVNKIAKEKSAHLPQAQQPGILYLYPPAPLDVAMLRALIREEMFAMWPALLQAQLDFLRTNDLVMYASQPQKEPSLDEREI